MSDDTDEPPGSVDTGEPPPPPVMRVRPPAPPHRRRSRARYRLRRAIALFFLVVIGFGAWFAWSLWQPFAGDGSGAVVVTIPAHTGTRAVGDLLARDGVVDSGFFFSVRALLDGDRSKLLPGTYHLRRGMSYSAALHALTTRPKPVKRRPVVTTTKLTIPEGFRRDQIATLAHSKGVLGSYYVASRRARGFHPRTYGAPRHLHSLEGFLFPATYPVARGESAATLVGQQLLAFEQSFDGLDFAHAKAAELTRYDVLIIASIVQAEAKPPDFAKVAAVIYNRLHAGMRLQVEATVRYFLHDYTHSLTSTQLAIDNPYNSYVHSGLPPGPIGNPGLAAMTAAAHPAHVSYLYYVNKPYTCGRLAFATSYATFLTEKAAYDNARAKNGYHEPSRCPA